jgi:threonine dehydrogenase-like Zn-dependent dehydrogenase
LKLLTPSDAIVQVMLAGICGTNLEFAQNGPELSLRLGMRVGHEFVSVVQIVGKGVPAVKLGDCVGAVRCPCTPLEL